MSVPSEFPVWGLLPKKETGVAQFLTKHPEYDGRGVVIAIFDSGVDPGAPGLQVTSTGKTKVIERYDCSGAGDVDTSTVVTATDSTIQGVTGRKLTVPKDWKNPTGQYHLGVVNPFSLYPQKLKERIKKERKEKLWDPFHRQALADASRKIEVKEESSGDNAASDKEYEKLLKEDKEATLEALNNLEKKYNDVGPSFDCVVYHDGENWRACIDTTEEGALEKGVHLGEYTRTLEYAPLTEDDQLNITINVYNNGNVLEIVSMCSPHGTHVASIAAACFPDEPEKNGVAPGAQIISMSIGDVRLGSMETGTALVRAMIKIMQRTAQNRIHVINMSYGEHSHWSCAGRIGELITEVVDKHLVTWVASAGNNGPALCSISTPPDIHTNCLIGVGAYVSPEMMAAEYAMAETVPGTAYTWSSRCPTPDGGWVVSVCAPGGAITSVPNFTLRNTQLMNGTSMAAPHVTGAVAILMSGMLAKGYPFSPQSIQRALENSAQYLPDVDVFAQGYGLLQVEKAFESLCANYNEPERDVRIAVCYSKTNSKGIMFRKPLPKLKKTKECMVKVEPIFHENADKRVLIDFNMRLNLVCSATWVHSPAHLDLSNMARNFIVRIDASGLQEGVHTTSIRAYDCSNVEKGPVFRFPITIVVPTIIKTNFVKTGVTFKPGTIMRHFLQVPEASTWASITFRTAEKEGSGKFMVHCMQLLPRQACTTLEMSKMFAISSVGEITLAFACRGGVTLEVAVAKFWSSTNAMDLDYTVEFRGTKPDQPSLTMVGHDGIHAVELHSGVRLEEIVPSISLKHCVLPLRCTESKITAGCAERDVIPPGRQIYELVLTYALHLNKACEITPACPLLCNTLYESEFESQLWMLFDAGKQLVAVGDAYPSKYSAKVEKGDYVIKLYVRHDKRELLEKLTDTWMLVWQKLCQPISLDVYVSQSQAMVFGKKMALACIPPGHNILPIYITPLKDEKVLKSIPPGSHLQGTITFSKDELGKKVDQYKFKYMIPEAKKKVEKEKEKDKDKTKFDELEDSMREFAISWLSKLEPGEKARGWYEKLKVDHPNNLQVHTAMLSIIDPVDNKRFSVLPFFQPDQHEDKISSSEELWQSVLTICDEIISAVDVTQLLAQVAIKNDARLDATTQKQNADKQKAALVDAFARKGCVLAKLEAVKGTKDLKSVHNVWKELLKFVDPNDSKVWHFMIWHAVAHGHLGRALRYLSKMADERPCEHVERKIAEVCQILGWSHAHRLITSSLPYKYPQASSNSKS